MPYTARGKWVMVKRNGKWVPRHEWHRLCKTPEEARKRAAAMNMAMAGKKGK